MGWDIDAALTDFQTVTRLAGAELPIGAIAIEKLPAPHVQPSSLPAGKMAVYVFSKGLDVLKVGKAGPNSNARYTSQHYNARSAPSTFASSVVADRQRLGLGEIDPTLAGKWIKENIDRVNLLMDGGLGMPVLSLFESFLQCRLKPWYEGPKSQRP